MVAGGWRWIRVEFPGTVRIQEVLQDALRERLTNPWSIQQMFTELLYSSGGVAVVGKVDKAAFSELNNKN